MAKAKKKNGCECLIQLNEQLKETNTQIDTQLAMDFSKGEAKVFPTISTSKRDSKKRERAKTVLPLYCPFCGVAY